MLMAIKNLPSSASPNPGDTALGIIYENSAIAEMQMATLPLEAKPVLLTKCTLFSVSLVCSKT